MWLTLLPSKMLGEDGNLLYNLPSCMTRSWHNCQSFCLRCRCMEQYATSWRQVAGSVGFMHSGLHSPLGP